MPTIQLRIDKKTKQSAKKVLNDIGMDISSAIKIYLKQVVIRNGIPFQLVTENGLTVEEEHVILNASRDAKLGRKITKITNWKQAKAHLDSIKSKK